MTDQTPTPATGYCPACGRGDCAPTADQYEQQRAQAEEWRRKAVHRALTISRLRGTIDALIDLAGEKITDPGPRGAGYREAIGDLREALREYGHLDTEACAYPHGKPGIASLLEHVGLDTSGGVTVAGSFVAQPCTCGGTSPINHVYADQHPPVPDSGPTVAEAAQGDRNWDVQKGGE